MKCKGLGEPLKSNPDFQIARYVAQTCTPEEKAAFEAHCLDCDFCRVVLGIVLRICFSYEDEDGFAPDLPDDLTLRLLRLIQKQWTVDSGQ